MLKKKKNQRFWSRAARYTFGEAMRIRRGTLHIFKKRRGQFKI